MPFSAWCQSWAHGGLPDALRTQTCALDAWKPAWGHSKWMGRMQHERSFVRSRLINDSCGGKMRIPDEDTRWWISKCACNGLMPQVAANLLVWTRFGGLPVFDVFQSPIYSRSHWIIRVPYFLWLNILISGNTRSHSTRTFCWLNVSWHNWCIDILSLTHHCTISAPSPRNAPLSMWYAGTTPWH